MPEISLKTYLAKLNTLLSENAADAVIAHCRHILKSYPKNVAAYRALGRALVINGRWEEARSALRRVLGAIPDDFVAHVGLSEVSERLSRPEDAIWHLERAYEQRANDAQLIEALRDLYRRYRNIEQPKIQLTAAAVARGQLRASNYTQAVDTLRSALNRTPNRTDLSVMLAQTLWQQGAQEEAAEIALDILATLPDCLEANRMMAALWLSYDRPSDAQRFVNRLENLDPYLAVEVVQGTTPDEDAFRLDELDYKRAAQSELTSARPDWLQDIGAGGLMALAEREAEPEVTSEDADPWTSAILASRRPAEVEEEEIPDLFGSSEPTAASDRFAALQGAASDDDLEALFGDSTSNDVNALFPDEDSTTTTPEDDDPFAWMRAAGVEVVDDEDVEPSFSPLFDGEDEYTPSTPESSVAWAEQLGVEIEDADEFGMLHDDDEDEPLPDWMSQADDEPPASILQGDQFGASTSDDDDLPDWMRDDELLDEQFGIEALTNDAPNFDLFSDTSTPTTDDDFTTNFEPSLAAGGDENLDWLQTTEDVFASEDAAPSFDEDDDQASAASEAQPPAEPAQGGGLRGLTSMLSSSDFDWQSQPDQEDSLMQEDDMDDWLNQFGPPENKPASSASDTPDWLSDLNVDDEAAPAESAFPAMSTSSADDEPSDDDDWLAEFAPDESYQPDANFDPGEITPSITPTPVSGGGGFDDDFFSSDDEDEESLTVEDMPTWLMSSDDEDEEQPVSSGESMSEDDADDFAWLSEAELTDEDDAVSFDAEAEPINDDIPDWLTELEPETPPAAAATPSSSDEDDDFAWLSESGLEEDQAQDDTLRSVSEARSAYTPEDDSADWLSELEPESEVSEPEAAATSTDDFSWLSEAELESDQVESVQDTPAPMMSDADEDAEPVSADIPDWLSEMEPPQETQPAEPEAEAVSEEDFAWLNDSALADAENTVATTESDALTSIEGGSSEWLAEFEMEDESETPSETAEPIGVGDDDFAWLNESADTGEAVPDADAVEVVSADMPDWLSEAQPDNEEQPDQPLISESEPVSENEEDFAWLADDAYAVDENTHVVTETVEAADLEPADEDTSSWLLELEPNEEDTPIPETGEPAAVGDQDFAWDVAEEYNESEDEALAAEAVSADDEDWLSVLDEPIQAPSTEPAVVAAIEDAEPDDFALLGLDDDAMSEESDRSEPLMTDEPRHDFEQPEPEEEVEIYEPIAEVESSDVDADVEPTEDEVADEFVAAEERVVDEIIEEELTPVPASNAPDWLNAMVPGLDIDYTERDDALPEEEFIEEPPSPEYERVDGGDNDWLYEIVEAEENAVPAEVETAAPHFVFTRPPAWLGAAPTAADDDFPDWVDDENNSNDDDIPEWLR